MSFLKNTFWRLDLPSFRTFQQSLAILLAEQGHLQGHGMGTFCLPCLSDAHDLSIMARLPENCLWFFFMIRFTGPIPYSGTDLWHTYDNRFLLLPSSITASCFSVNSSHCACANSPQPELYPAFPLQHQPYHWCEYLGLHSVLLTDPLLQACFSQRKTFFWWQINLAFWQDCEQTQMVQLSHKIVSNLSDSCQTPCWANSVHWGMTSSERSPHETGNGHGNAWVYNMKME